MHCPICDHKMYQIGKRYICKNADCTDPEIEAPEDIETAEEIDMRTKHHIGDYL